MVDAPHFRSPRCLYSQRRPPRLDRSRIVSLGWSDLLWSGEQIRICKRWAKGADGETKTAASNGYVPMHPALAQYLKEWREQSPHSKVDDFVFPSLLKDGKVPIRASTFVQDHLRPAAVSAGVVLLRRDSASVFATCGTAQAPDS
ncbi:MAG: hypothetical protein WCB58_06550 [Acidobacteriaceae bacterium]